MWILGRWVVGLGDGRRGGAVVVVGVVVVVGTGGAGKEVGGGGIGCAGEDRGKRRGRR